MNVNIKIIPHDQQRYPTVGDWWLDQNGDLQIRVSKLSDPRREHLIAFHEYAEFLMCQEAGITAKMVDDFDTKYEADRHPDNEDEPGDDPSAPYVKQHCIATGFERMLAGELGVCWKEYEEELSALP